MDPVGGAPHLIHCSLKEEEEEEGEINHRWGIHEKPVTSIDSRTCPTHPIKTAIESYNNRKEEIPC